MNRLKRVVGANCLLVACCLGLVFTGGCRGKKTLRATVRCTYVKTGVRCTASHSKGKKPLSVCWDVTIKCKNGTEIRGGGCQVVKPGSEATKLIPAVELPNHGKCDKPTKTEVSNVRALRAVSD